MNTHLSAMTPVMENRENFARNLRELRNGRKLSQEELGFLVGVHRTTIGNLEIEKHAPNLITMQKIAGALGVTIEDLLKEPENSRQRSRRY